MTFVDRSLALVRHVVMRIGKKPLTDRIGLSDAILRKVDQPEFAPTAVTLRKLEAASREVLKERGEEIPDDVQSREGGGA